jgi:VWFA-related protein
VRARHRFSKLSAAVGGEFQTLSRGAPRRIVRVAGLCAALASLIAAGQNGQPEAVRESTSVMVVEIPVNVIDREGKPVTGLTAADFELSDDGKKQTISRFEVIDLRPPAAARRGVTPPAIEPAARRHWLITFDLSYASLSGLLRAREGAKAFVTRAVGNGDLAAVSTLSVDAGWRLLVNFTADRDQLSRAIDTLGVSPLAIESLDPLSFAYEPPGRRGGGSEERIVEALRETRANANSSADDLARGRVNQLMESLATMARALDSVRGRKHVLFFSEGFEARLIAGNAADKPSLNTAGQLQLPYEADAAAAASGEIWRVDSDARFGSTSTRAIMAQALSEFRRSDTALDTIDISGLRSEPDASWPSKPGAGTDSLFAMASETGGDFVRNANRLGGELEGLVERTRLVYLLVYKPESLTKPGTFHTLQVRVKRPGTKVQARSGYSEPRAFTALSRIERVLGAGDLITGGPRENSFSAAVVAAPFASGGKLSQVPFIIEIPGGPLLDGDSGPEGRIQIFTYATDANGTLADYLTQEMTLDLARVRPSLETGGIKFYGTLFLPPGDFTVRTLIQNGSTGTSAVIAKALRVDEVPGADALVLPPFFRATTGRWMMVKAIPRPDAPARATEYPFAIQGEAFIPAALPTLETGTAAQVLVLTYNFAGRGRIEPLQIYPEIAGADGKPRAVEIQVVRRSDRERAGGRALVLSFKPDDLPAGRYVLRVRVSDRVSRKSSEASTDFEVRSAKS